MTTRRRFTLTQYLIEQRRRFPGASGDFNALLLDVSLACKAIARIVAFGELDTTIDQSAAAPPAAGGAVNVQGEVQKKLDVISNEILLDANEWGGHLAAMASEEMDLPFCIPNRYPKGEYLLVFDPLDGSSNIDVNISVGTIFSVLKAPEGIDCANGAAYQVAPSVFWELGAEIVAELIGASSGIGHMITDSQALLATDQIIFGIIVIGLIGLASDLLFKWANRRLYPWAQLGR